MRHYATLFDQNYAAKGLALHASLLKHSSEPFTLHILAMDKEVFWLLAEMELPHVELIPLESFEKALKMEPVRKSRSWTEYCWTCASSLMDYMLKQVEAVTYLDSDLFFFSDPKPIRSELETYSVCLERSIGITEHRFNDKDRQRLGQNGRFNVGVVHAKATTIGLLAISRWADQCREWCFNRIEKGKFADQAYLDSWPTQYPNQQCWSYDNIGINAGPWNIGNFKVWQEDGKVYLTETPKGAPHLATYWGLVCYHFHEFQDGDHLTNWPLRPCDRDLIYAPYVRAFNEMTEQIKVVKARMMARRDEVLQQAGRA